MKFDKVRLQMTVNFYTWIVQKLKNYYYFFFFLLLLLIYSIVIFFSFSESFFFLFFRSQQTIVDLLLESINQFNHLTLHRVIIILNPVLINCRLLDLTSNNVFFQSEVDKMVEWKRPSVVVNDESSTVVRSSINSNRINHRSGSIV